MKTNPYCLAFCMAIPLIGCARTGTNPEPDADSGSWIVRAGADGGAASESSGKAACNSPGQTRTCCTGGTSTCAGPAEFTFWGPCLDAQGKTLACSRCADNEFGPGCDAGVPDGGTACGTAEFSASCDAGVPRLCSDSTINNEPEILAAYTPASGRSVSAHGQIKVWVNDERAPIIAPNEVVDLDTGLIRTPGDRTAKAGDGYLWEPALYIAPQTAENGGTPHFPQAIKGWYNNNPASGKGKPSSSLGAQVNGMDSPPAGTLLPERFTGEDIWDVDALGLAPGTYIAEFVIHDGDKDRAVGCTTIVVEPAR
jgi:hypothetical protein